MGAMASYLVVFHEPMAAGCGIPEIKMYLNEIEVPRLFDLKTFCVKLTSAVLGYAGGLLGSIVIISYSCCFIRI